MSLILSDFGPNRAGRKGVEPQFFVFARKGDYPGVQKKLRFDPFFGC
jgi:hypothetical protein